jgi:hypothetical protein
MHSGATYSGPIVVLKLICCSNPFKLFYSESSIALIMLLQCKVFPNKLWSCLITESTSGSAEAMVGVFSPSVCNVASLKGFHT